MKQVVRRYHWSVVVTGALFIIAGAILVHRQTVLSEAYAARERLVGSLRTELIALAPLEPLPPADRSAEANGLESCEPVATGRCTEKAASPATRQTMLDVDVSSIQALKARLGLERASGHVLVLLFAPTDCTLCLSEAAAWRRLHEEHGREDGSGLSVVAIMDRTTLQEAPMSLAGLGLASVPGFLDAASTLRRSLGIVETPFKMLLNSYGQVVLVDHANRTAAGQSAFEASVEALLGETATGAGRSP